MPTEHLETILKKMPRAVFLTPEQYQTLTTDAIRADLANDPDRATPKPPVKAVILSAAFTGTITPGADVIAFTVKYEIENLSLNDNEWAEVPLQLPRMYLGKVEIDSQTALRVAAPTKKGAAPPMLLTHGRGRHKVVAHFHLPVRHSSNGDFISIPAPGVAAAVLTLSLPADAELKSALPFIRNDSGTSARFVLPARSKTGHEIHWTAQKVAPIPGAAILQTCSYIYNVDSTRIQADLGMVINSSLSDLPNQYDIHLPKNVRVLSVEGTELLRWTRDANSGVVKITLLPGERNAADLRILAETDVPGTDEDGTDIDITLPIPTIPGIHRANGTFALIGSDDIRVKQILTNTLTAAIPDNVEGGISNLPNYIASFSFPAMTESPSLTLSPLRNRFNAQIDTLISLKREAIYLTRTLNLIPREGNLFTVEIALPGKEEILSIESPGGKNFTWSTSGNAAGKVRLSWEDGLSAGNPARVTIQTRLDPEGWYSLGDEAATLSFQQATIENAGAVSGYVAVQFDPSFQVETADTNGLEPRDGRSTPVKGILAWFRLNDFALTINASRRPPEVEATIISYALPLANTLEIEGQIDLNILYSGIKEIQVSLPENAADKIRFDSPLIAEQTLADDGRTWTLTFHQERSGFARLPYRIVLPLEMKLDSAAGEGAEKKFSIALPHLKIPSAKRIRGDWMMEANTDTEIAFEASGLDSVDSLRVPLVAGYQPRHRVIAAFQYRGEAWDLKLSGTRHAHTDLVSTVIDSLRIDTVVSTDGTDRHQARLRLRSSGEQFLELKLPEDAVLWTLQVDDKTIKPVRAGKDTLRVQLPAHENSRRQINVSLIYQTPGKKWGGSGRETLDPVRVANRIPVMRSEWFLHLPEGFDYQKFKTNLGKEFQVVDRVFLGQAAGKAGDVLEGLAELNPFTMPAYNGILERAKGRPNEAAHSDFKLSSITASSAAVPTAAGDAKLSDAMEAREMNMAIRKPSEPDPFGGATDLVIRKQERVKKADAAALRGSQLMADSDYDGAIEQYRAALDLLPSAPMTEQRKRAYAKQFARASVLVGRQRADEGRYNEAIALVEEVLQPSIDSTNIDALRLLEQLNDPDYYTPALTPQHWERIQKVKVALRASRGFIDLGDYDRADREYNKTLSDDPYNVAARRGMESDERHKQDYYDEARKHTRSQFLRDVAKGWAMPIPDDVAGSGIQQREEKLKTIIIPSLEFSDTPLRDALDFLSQRSVELDVNEPDPAKKGINIVMQTGGDVGDTPITLRLTNVPVAEALRYTTALAQLKYKVESHAVVVVPISTPDSDLFTNTYIVPPTFLSAGTGSGGGMSGADPFAAPADSGATLLARRTAKSILEDAGISFSAGSSAIYDATNSRIIVRNTQDQMELVESVVESLAPATQSNADVSGIAGGRNVSVGGGFEGNDGRQQFGDFDNGGGMQFDRPYINKPDEVNANSLGIKFTQSEKIGNANQEALKKITLDELDLSGKTLAEAASMLNEKLAEQGDGGAFPAGRFPQIELVTEEGDTATADKKISGLKLGKMSFWDALDKLTGASNTHYEVTASGILIARADVPLEPMQSIFIPLPASEFGDLGARRVLTEAGIKFPPGSGTAYNPGSGQLAVKNTRENLEAVMKLYAHYLTPQSSSAADSRYARDLPGGETGLRGFDYRGVGRLPIEFELPHSGRSYRFQGLFAPDTIHFRYVNWDRQIRVAWIWILVGGLGFWLGAWRRLQQPVFIGLAGMVVLTFVPLLVSSTLTVFCNALLIGWLVAMAIWVLYRFFEKEEMEESV